ncbi:hypothetical protein D3C72_1478820 [compost metagenome]
MVDLGQISAAIFDLIIHDFLDELFAPGFSIGCFDLLPNSFPLGIRHADTNFVIPQIIQCSDITWISFWNHQTDIVVAINLCMTEVICHLVDRSFTRCVNIGLMRNA